MLGRTRGTQYCLMTTSWGMREVRSLTVQVLWVDLYQLKIFPGTFPLTQVQKGSHIFLHIFTYLGEHWRNPNPLVVGVTIPSGSIELFI